LEDFPPAHLGIFALQLCPTSILQQTAGATADAMYAVGNAIGAVLAYSLVDMIKNDKDMVVA
ncbi:MAG TPA: hypothetical protein PK535_10180, partial [Synergistaceae bacterium]|nr:hypothetical protein [Synergistaceae bacterium]